MRVLKSSRTGRLVRSGKVHAKRKRPQNCKISTTFTSSDDQTQKGLRKPRKDHDMGAQDTIKTITTKAKARSDPTAVTPEEQEQQSLGQRKQPESRFCLQVDRQTKASYATYEAAEQAALVIKKRHPIVRVAIYDTVESVNKVIDLP
jgi:hypothetical protein